uniref:Uncharacterized protein n=1 Tax=Ixodes ricinus TaxID=34613 RepID=A0A6B0UFM4_IXORI
MGWWSPRSRKRLLSFNVHGMTLTMWRAIAHTTRAETQAVSGRLINADGCLDVMDATLTTARILETLDPVVSRNSHVADQKEVTGRDHPNAGRSKCHCRVPTG